MLVQSFIDKKCSQLTYYIQAFWQDELPYAELENFMWDTFEEWAELEHKQNQLYTHKERIFWHLLHQTQYVSAKSLREDNILKDEIDLCLHYLKTNRACPFDVVGMRP